MNHNKIKTLTTSSLFMALTCIATMIIKLPTPGTGGYVHLGDAFVILSGILLGPLYGAIAGGIGSALADLFGGYFIYVPITLIVKALIAGGVGLIYHKLAKNIHKPFLKCLLCGIYATILVAGGYLFFESFLYGSAALASVPANIGQGISGLMISTILLPILQKIHISH
ncbi:MAG: ECF transporter S component [Lachnospiraceae bacterium]|nr:ECF transporter S component [Lachnospiraceae bacterium]